MNQSKTIRKSLSSFKMASPVRDNRTKMFYARVAIPEQLRSIMGGNLK